MGAERGLTKLRTCLTSGKSTRNNIKDKWSRILRRRLSRRGISPPIPATSARMRSQRRRPAISTRSGKRRRTCRRGQLSNTNLQPYMDPYTQDVINATLPIMQQHPLQQNQQQNAANSSNACSGGSRCRRSNKASLQAQGAQNMAQMAQQLNQANFTQAQAGAQNDIANTLKAQQGNQSAALQQGALANQASAGLGTLGNQQMQNNIANYGMLTSAGGFEQQQGQNDINAQLAKFNQAFQYPQQQLGDDGIIARHDALRHGLFGHVELDHDADPIESDGGGAGRDADARRTVLAPRPLRGRDPRAAAGIGSLFSGFSDRSAKTDITKLGKDPKTGLDIGMPIATRATPKLIRKWVGPMAQDVEEAYPGSTERVGKNGKLAISPLCRRHAVRRPEYGRCRAWLAVDGCSGADSHLSIRAIAAIDDGSASISANDNGGDATARYGTNIRSSVWTSYF